MKSQFFQLGLTEIKSQIKNEQTKYLLALESNSAAGKLLLIKQRMLRLQEQFNRATNDKIAGF